MGAFEQLGSPFWEDSRGLLELDQSIVSEIKVKYIGFKLYTAFLSRVCSQVTAFTATMHKTSLKWLNHGESHHHVFYHESSTLHPLLTLKGSLQRGNKDEILDSIVPADLAHAVTTVAVLDGAVLISIFRPKSSMTMPQTSLFCFTPKRHEHEGGLHSQQKKY